jgi:hypothetical protein
MQRTNTATRGRLAPAACCLQLAPSIGDDARRRSEGRPDGATAAAVRGAGFLTMVNH